MQGYFFTRKESEALVGREVLTTEPLSLFVVLRSKYNLKLNHVEIGKGKVGEITEAIELAKNKYLLKAVWWISDNTVASAHFDKERFQKSLLVCV